MAQSFADNLRNILNEIKEKYNVLTYEEQITLKTDVESFINCNPQYGPNALHRRILDPRYIYEDDAPHLFAFIGTYNEPDRLHWLVVRMIIDYMLDADKVTKDINNLLSNLLSNLLEKG